MNDQRTQILKNLNILMGDIRWLLKHQDSPSYPLILTVFAGIEYAGWCLNRLNNKTENAIRFMKKYMTGYNQTLQDGKQLPFVLYKNLRSAITHHGGARGGILVSHEESAEALHLQFCNDDGPHLVVHSRSLASDFLTGCELAISDLKNAGSSGDDDSQKRPSKLDHGYPRVGYPEFPGTLQKPPFNGTNATGG